MRTIKRKKSRMKKRKKRGRNSIITYFKRNKRRITHKSELEKTINNNIFGQDLEIQKDIKKSNEETNSYQIKHPAVFSHYARRFGATTSSTCQRNLIQYFGRKYFEHYSKSIYPRENTNLSVNHRIVSLDHHPSHNLVCAATNRTRIYFFRDTMVSHVMNMNRGMSRARFSVDGNCVIVSHFSRKNLDIFDITHDGRMIKSIPTKQCNLDFCVIDRNTILVVGEKIKVLDLRERPPPQPTSSSSSSRINPTKMITSNKKKKKKRPRGRYTGLGFGSSRKTIESRKSQKQKNKFNPVRTVESGTRQTKGLGPPRCVCPVSNSEKHLFVVGNGSHVLLYDIRRKTGGMSTSPTSSSITSSNFKNDNFVKIYNLKRLFTECFTSLMTNMSHTEMIDKKKKRVHGVSQFWMNQFSESSEKKKSSFFNVDKLIQHPSISGILGLTTSNGYAGLLDLNRYRVLKLFKQKDQSLKYESYSYNTSSGSVTPTPCFFTDEFSRVNSLVNSNHHTFFMLPNKYTNTLKILDWSRLDTPEVLLMEKFRKLITPISQYNKFEVHAQPTVISRSAGSRKMGMKVGSLFCNGAEISCVMSVPNRGGEVVCGISGNRLCKFNFQIRK